MKEDPFGLEEVKAKPSSQRTRKKKTKQVQSATSVGKSESNTPTAEKKDYGSTGLCKASRKQMEDGEKLMAELIDKLGFYEVMSCVARGCLRIAKQRDRSRGHGGDVYRNLATVVDHVVDNIRKS